jgi:hypothetical protein
MPVATCQNHVDYDAQGKWGARVCGLPMEDICTKCKATVCAKHLDAKTVANKKRKCMDCYELEDRLIRASRTVSARKANKSRWSQKRAPHSPKRPRKASRAD